MSWWAVVLIVLGGWFVIGAIIWIALSRTAWTDEPAGIVDPDQDEGRAP